ncbi:MAG: peptidylprolyl isomerase [Pseudomonadota bacterium]
MITLSLRTWLKLGLMAAGLLGTAACSADAPATASQPASTAQTATENAGTASDAPPRARIETSLGNIEIEFLPKQAPATTAHILKLIDDGFYEGLIFHRVVAGFVVQTGGYTREMARRDYPETVVNESANGLSNLKGTLAMARLAHPDSADSQWFINVRNNRRLDGARNKPGYTVFARVTGGWETVTAIELTNTVLRKNADGIPLPGVPETPIEILKIVRL